MERRNWADGADCAVMFAQNMIYWLLLVSLFPVEANVDFPWSMSLLFCFSIAIFWWPSMDTVCHDSSCMHPYVFYTLHVSNNRNLLEKSNIIKREIMWVIRQRTLINQVLISSYHHCTAFLGLVCIESGDAYSYPFRYIQLSISWYLGKTTFFS